MTIDEAMPDLQWIDVLPGRKILLKGNHDYWWSSIGRVRGALPPSLRAVQNDIDEADGVTIAGARGWDMPAAGWCEDLEKDRKIYERERGRLRRSLEQAPAGRPIVAMMHYPPFVPAVEEFGFHDILKAFGVHAVVFRHYHGPDGAKVFQGTRDGIRYVFCAADSRDFCPVRLSID
ncbi:MAG: phosphohydrolase [Deltaproteobacteria bacterium]|nr:phosphohydrolase [Deltaproteobacteria bacterium]